MEIWKNVAIAFKSRKFSEVERVQGKQNPERKKLVGDFISRKAVKSC